MIICPESQTMADQTPSLSFSRARRLAPPDLLPGVAALLGALDRRLPLVVRQVLVEVPLNQLFASALRQGDFDPFEGRTLELQVADGGPAVTLGLWRGRLRLVEGTGEARIRGSWAAFRSLLQGSQDADQLFFQRALVLEGDTELGLGVRNLLDSLEWRPWTGH